jgi:hypothetical protein
MIAVERQMKKVSLIVGGNVVWGEVEIVVVEEVEEKI